MRKTSSILVLFVLLGFGVSLAVPAEDMPETAYDESEALPYEGTPEVSIAAPKTVPEALAVRAGASQLLRTSPRSLTVRRSDSWAELPHRVSHTLTILDHSFRC